MTDRPFGEHAKRKRYQELLFLCARDRTIPPRPPRSPAFFLLWRAQQLRRDEVVRAIAADGRPGRVTPPLNRRTEAIHLMLGI